MKRFTMLLIRFLKRKDDFRIESVHVVRGTVDVVKGTVETGIKRVEGRYSDKHTAQAQAITEDVCTIRGTKEEVFAFLTKFEA